jgi:hypothetical protein
MRGLRINQETHTVNVQCVINRTTHALIWELMPLASNEDWLTYLQNASHWQWPLVLLVSVHQNPLINIEAAALGDENIDEEVEEANIEAGGTAAPQYGPTCGFIPLPRWARGPLSVHTDRGTSR